MIAKTQLAAADYLHSKRFFCIKEIEERDLELRGIISTFIDLDKVEIMRDSAERKYEVLQYLADLVDEDIIKRQKYLHSK